MEMNNESEKPLNSFDHVLANALIGKYVLIGINYQNNSGEINSQQQVHGIIESADEKLGLVVNLKGKRDTEKFYLPPDTRSFFIAKPGEYRLRSTGEIINDPDYTSEWTITEGVF